MSHAKAVPDTLLVVPLAGGAPRGAITRVEARDVALNETWFQKLVATSPEVVMDACAAADLLKPNETWKTWGREVAAGDSGSIDVLLVSSRGRVAIVETKLSYNPGVRREVVAQILDYALALQELPLDALPPLPPDFATKEDVATCLRAGEFLLIVTGDQLDPRAIRLARGAMGVHLTNDWDLAMIDLNLYRRDGAPDDIVVVPEVRGILVREGRQVVCIRVEGASATAKVYVESAPAPEESSARGERWNEERFFAAIREAELDPRFLALADFVRDAKRADRLSLGFGRGQSGSMTVKVGAGGLFDLMVDGRLTMKPASLVQQALEDRADAFLAGLKQLFPEVADSWKFVAPSAAAAKAGALQALLKATLTSAG